MTSMLIQRLETVLADIGDVAVAVSGGVDSMTLAVVAHRAGAGNVEMCHAVSPAVPPQSTDRVREYAQTQGWTLKVMNAGEFGDERYMANPANRCFFCKTNLYGAMVSQTNYQLVSGTNTDDLGDYRPGLIAAQDHDVRHPFVEANISKADVRAIAASLGLDDIAELPAAPCLSSRIETGISIDPAQLTAVNTVELSLRDALSPDTVRCRVRKEGVVVELDHETLEGLSDEDKQTWTGFIQEAFATSLPGLTQGKPTQISFESYRMGSAFLVEIR